MSKSLGVGTSGCCSMGGGGCCYEEQAGLHFASGSSCLYLLQSRDRYVPSHRTPHVKFWKSKTEHGLTPAWRNTPNCTKNSRQPGTIGKFRQEDHDLKTSLCHIKAVSKAKKEIQGRGEKKYLLRDADSQDQDSEGIKVVSLISRCLASVQYAFRLCPTLIPVNSSRVSRHPSQ